MILKGSVITKYMKKGALGMSVVKTKTKYEGEHFYNGSILIIDTEEDRFNGAHKEHYVII